MAVWNRCPGTEPAIRPTQFIFHTAVMRDLFDLQDFFCSGRSGGVESHFGVGGKWGRSLAQDGMARQWRDTEEQADANRTANVRAISVETCDNAPRFAADIEEWTPKQVQKLVQLGRWALATHGIPARVCRTPDDPGFGWHAMWDNTRFELPDGTTPWTPSAGKQCPGPVRIAQLKRDILPAIFADAEPAPQLSKESDMPFILRADGDRALKLVVGGQAQSISNDDRSAHTAAGVTELNYTGHPAQYDDALALATSTPQALRNTLVRAELALASGQDNAEFKSGDPTIPDGDLPTDERLVRALHDAAGVAHLTAPPPV
jgi:hypothetical protein